MVVVCGGSSNFFREKKEAKPKNVGKNRCCLQVGVSCPALCVWNDIAERRAWQNSSVFCSTELGDARDMLMFVKQIRRSQEKLGTERSEYVLSPRRCVGKCFYRENTAEEETRSSHVLRTHRTQHKARGLPVAWNCVIAQTSATYRNSCVFG